MFEGHLPFGKLVIRGEVQRHHDHPGDPEENDVVARDQHTGRQKRLHIGARFGVVIGPAEGGEREKRRGKPSVEYVWVALDWFAACLGLCFRFSSHDIHVARVVIPRRDLMPPPELARDTPVLNVGQPMVVGRRPMIRIEPDFTRGNRTKAALSKTIHFYKPLIGQHRLDDGIGAV